MSTSAGDKIILLKHTTSCLVYLYLQGITLKSIMTVDVLFKLEVVAETVEFKVSLKSTVFCTSSHQSVLHTLRPIKLHSIHS